MTAHLERTVVHKATGETITFLETAEETNGKYLYIEVSLPPQGDGPPLHVHDEFEEEFEVISGQLTVTLGKKKEQHILQPGEKRLVTKLTPHTFTNNHDEPVTFRVRLTPPSQFEQSVRIHYGLMADALTDDKGNPTTSAHTALILSMQNTWIAGIPLFIQKFLFKRLVNKGRKQGLYKTFSKYTGKDL